ncbi:putative Chymotrypsin-like protease CTRL-1 [Hypsibius exemplaris]|uniref:limulus clotting factor C n=1 Tax=Hypsibius exemplaris TaxID=2072580 RepID=A0A1W0WHJ7_HYPEX|nr:putative Chymotrypsin-like protease CTRL-1 [Hypsibius exemplaris]
MNHPFWLSLLASITVTCVYCQDGTCGIPPISPVLNETQFTRVRGGEEAVSGSWPWQVRVGFKNPLGQKAGFMCGGSIIDRRHILTASHCFAQFNLSQQKFFVRVGDHSVQVVEARQADYDVDTVTNHPGFVQGPTGVRDDITVLKLSIPITYSATVQPICLGDQGSDAVDDRVCVVTGWGSTVNQVTGIFRGTRIRRQIQPPRPIIIPSDVLKQAVLPILERSYCRQIWGQIQIDENMICTAAEQLDREPCQGDSGGPLVCQVEGNPGQWVQEGVVSFGAGCGQNGPAVFTRVGQYRNWIKGITDRVVTISLGKEKK